MKRKRGAGNSHVMRTIAYEIFKYAGATGSSIVSGSTACVAFKAPPGMRASSCWMILTGLRIVSGGCLELDEPSVVTYSSGSTSRPNARSGRIGEGGSENDVAPDWRLSEVVPCVGELASDNPTTRWSRPQSTEGQGLARTGSWRESWSGKRTRISSAM